MRYIIDIVAVSLLKKDVFQALEVFSRMTYIFLVVVKMFLVQTKKIKNIIITMTSEEEKIHKQANYHLKSIYAYHVNYCRLIIFWIVIFLYAAGLINIGMGFNQYFKWVDSVHRNDTTQVPRPHAVPFWYPFDKEKHYYIAVFYQIFHIYQTFAVNSSIQALMNSVMVFIRAQLKMLQYQIKIFDSEKFAEGGEDNTHFPKRNLRNLVKKHQEIIWV
ncbi:hypothetical protein GWI33_021642 [Rhynchophorus ferrugineus]|uniref:Odorant receptor n=1 Tax=Rhynchophorus ferrugineus TaxID=354439 RepID=A0A834MLN6_RHYFE|nr:hypothetical protein GWI33_021642 [Rhynchophorus ferrugineus]